MIKTPVNLTLNDGVEVSCAGDTRKGFTVVAREVRSLSEQSKSTVIVIDKVLGKSSELSTKAMVLLTEIVPKME